VNNPKNTTEGYRHSTNSAVWYAKKVSRKIKKKYLDNMNRIRIGIMATQNIRKAL